MRAVSSRFDTPTAVVTAIAAGADVVLVARPEPAPFITALERAVKSGKTSGERLAESLQRIATAKSALGLGGCV